MKRIVLVALALAVAACADSSTAPKNDCTMNVKTRKVPVCNFF